MELKLENSNGLALWMGHGDLVQVPMDPNERIQCRKALLDALDLLDQTIVKFDTFSTEGETGERWQQSPQHLSDCLAVYDSALPSKRQENSREPMLRLVSAHPQPLDCSGHGPSSYLRQK